MWSKFASILPLMIIWIYTINFRRLLLSFLGSMIFAFLEVSHYRITTGRVFTTKEQFIANLIFMPFMIENYNIIIPNIYLRFFLFPFNIWIFEIIMGYYMILLLGHNPAWKYETKYSYLNGLIALECYPRWFFLGLLQEFLYSYLFDQMHQMLW